MRLTFKLIQDIAEAEKLWEVLTPAETLYDDWDFRNTFHKYHKKELYFVAGYDGTTLIGLLPLQFNNDKGHLEFWGGSYMEDNRVMVVSGLESVIPVFYEHAKTLGKPLVLEYIRGNDPFTTGLTVQDYKFVLPLQKYTSTDDYITDIFSGETKKKLTKRLMKVEELGITVAENNVADIELLFDWNIAAFPDSAFIERPFHKEIFRDLVQTHKNFSPRLLTYTVAGKKQAVTMGVIYKKTYASINRGIDLAADKNLREYIQMKKITDALTHGCQYFDAFVGDYGWKERWGCQKIPQYSYYFPEKPAATH